MRLTAAPKTELERVENLGGCTGKLLQKKMMLEPRYKRTNNLENVDDIFGEFA